MAEENNKATDVWSVRRALDWTVGYLERKGDEHPRRSGEWLLSAATGLSRVEVYAFFDRPLTKPELDALHDSVVRRAQGEPLQYVTGEVAFRHIILKTGKNVLIPRPETEILVDKVLEAVDCVIAEKGSARVLEVGTGTGCISLSIAAERPEVSVVATDISKDAIELATRNRDALGLTDRLELIETDLIADLPQEYLGTFDVLVSNPPYIPTAEMKKLPLEVADFEPELALHGGVDGLDIFRRLVEAGRRALTVSGMLACELHEDTLNQAAQECVLWYTEINIHKDLTGVDRIVTAMLEKPL